MNIEQQIRDCEKKITFLEEFRRQNRGSKGHFDRDLDAQYEQIALLKIRKMMDY